MRTKSLALMLGLAGAIALGWTGLSGQQPATPGQTAPKPLFRSNTNIIRVDVTVRDKDGKVIRGLKPSDFQLVEDSKPQEITSFSFEELPTEAIPTDQTTTATVTPMPQIQALLSAPKPMVSNTPKPSAEPVPDVSPEKLPGKRLVIMLFDTSSMQPEEIDRAVKSGNDFVDKTMTVADVVGIFSVGQTLSVLRDFTMDRAQLKSALSAFDSTSGTGFEQPVAAADTSDDTDTSTDPADIPLDDSEFGIFNNDRRLRAMRVLCDAMAGIEQKKAMLYFSGGMARSGSDNEIELRNLTTACGKANVSIYPVDSRGLTAVVPGGSASQGSRGGSNAFSGRGVASQFSSLSASQETLTTIAADTGGQAFLDTNDFGKAFTQVEHDISAYYLLGYSSSNPSLDGKFRRITVKVTVPGARIEARKGYYAGADWAHLAKEDRERQLQDQISSAISATDLPVVATTSWFRTADANKYFVPLSIAVPGSALPPLGPKQTAHAIDFLLVMLDEQGRSVGRIRDTMNISVAQNANLAKQQLQYQSGVPLPAGHFMVKVAVRENTDGTLGAFEFPITIPDLKTATMKVSPIVFSTQLRSVRGGGPGGRGGPGGPGGFGGGGFGGPPMDSRGGGGGRGYGAETNPNPLISGGQEIMQSLSHLVSQTGRMYFYYEVYDPTLDPSGKPHLKTNLAFYRGRVKVFETDVVEKTTIDDPERHATEFSFEVPAINLKPGLYTCQVNVIDDVSGKFQFPRIAIYVK